MIRALASALLLFVLAPSAVHAQSVLPDDYEDPPARSSDDEEEEPPDAEADAAADEEVEKPRPVRKRAAVESSEKRSADVRKKSARKKPKFEPPNRHVSSGLGFELELGGLAALRRMKFTGTESEISHRPGVYLGGALRVAQHVLHLDSTNSHLFIEAEGGFGSAKNADVEPALGRPLVTEHAYLMALAVFEKPIGRAVDMRLGLGGIASSFTVEKNPDYTGHRYLALAAKFGAAYWTSDRIRIGGNLIFFPGISTNQSAGGYGAAQSFGGRGEAYLSWCFYQPEPPDEFGSAEFSVRYSYTRFQTTLPESQHLGDLARTADTQQAVVLTVSYHL